MNYDEALGYIHSAPKVAKIPGNDALKKVLKHLGSPEKHLKFVHIAGTNGKGSVSAMLNNVLLVCGYKTGLFISPYIERFNERISFNGKNISDDDLIRLVSKIKITLEETKLELSEFSIIFVIALMYFVEKKCDIVVLETGLGGRLDSTNAIESSLVSAITSIGFDHMQYLGNTIEEISSEKAGIIKNNGEVILYPDPEEKVIEVFKSKCSLMNASLTISKRPEVINDALLFNGKSFKLSLKGDYQYNNATVCLNIIEKLKNKGFILTDDFVKKGLLTTVWPGRFEWLTQKLLLDGCHNIDGVHEFSKSVLKLNKPITIVTGVMADKDYYAIASELAKITKNIIITKPDVARALECDEYKKTFEIFGVNAVVEPDVKSAVVKGLEFDGICAVCGSLYLIGEVRRLFGNKQ